MQCINAGNIIKLMAYDMIEDKVVVNSSCVDSS